MRIGGALWGIAVLPGADNHRAILLTAWFTAVVAVATVILAVVTLQSVRTQDTPARLTRSVDVVDRYTDHWNSAQLKQCRAVTARLIGARRVDATAITHSINNVSPILVLFQDLAI